MARGRGLNQELPRLLAQHKHEMGKFDAFQTSMLYVE